MAQSDQLVEWTGNRDRERSSSIWVGYSAAPVVGRDGEIALLESLLNRVRDGVGGTVLISGEAGSGKTTLIELTGDSASATGQWWVPIRCTRGAPQYWVWTQVVRTVLNSFPEYQDDLEDCLADFAVVNPLLPHASTSAIKPVSSGTKELDRFRAMEAVVRILECATSRRPLLLTIDDLQDTDGDSLRTLGHVLSSDVGNRFAAILSLTVPNPQSDVPGIPFLEEFRRARSVERIHLNRFEEADSVETVRRLSLGSVDNDAARFLHQRTGGNPFFLVEATRLLMRPAGSRDTVPANVRDAIVQQVSGLPPPAQEILRIVAVLESGISLGQIVERWGWEHAQRCLASGLVNMDDYSVAARPTMHSIVRDAVVSATSPEELARLHAVASDILARHVAFGRKELSESLARHSIRGVPFIDYETVGWHARDAARLALESYSFQRAEELCEAVLALDVSSSLRLELRTIHYLARIAHMADSETPEIVKEQDELFFELVQRGMHEEAVSVAANGIGIVSVGRDQLEMLTSALALPDSSRAERARISARMISGLGIALNRPREAREAYRSATEEFAGDARLLIELEIAAAHVELHQLAMSRAVQHGEKALEHLAHFDLPELHSRTERDVAWAYSHLGKTREGAFHGDAAVIAARRSRSPRVFAEIAVQVPYPVGCFGTLVESLEMLDEADRITPGDLRIRGCRVQLLAALGLFSRAQTEIMWMSDRWRRSRSAECSELIFLGAMHGNVVPVVEHLGLTTGVLDEGIEAGKSALQQHSELTPIWRLFAATGLGLAAIRKDDIALGRHAWAVLNKLRESTDVRLSLVVSVRALLAQLQIRFLDGGSDEAWTMLRNAADELRENEDRPRLAVALRDFAALQSHVGNVGADTLSTLDEAEQLAEGSGMVAMVDQIKDLRERFRSQLSDGPSDFGLSPRELEVLKLVVGGASNPAIAKALFISRHTVVRHVSNIFAKTQCASRVQLTAFAERHGLV